MLVIDNHWISDVFYDIRKDRSRCYQPRLISGDWIPDFNRLRESEFLKLLLESQSPDMISDSTSKNVLESGTYITISIGQSELHYQKHFILVMFRV